MRKYFPANVSFHRFLFCQQDGGKFCPFLVLTFLMVKLVSILLRGRVLLSFVNPGWSLIHVHPFCMKYSLFQSFVILVV